MTGYLLSLNGGPIAWKAARQGGVTLSSSEAEFIAASQAGKEVLYLRALLKGFACPQTKPTETWEDNDSCILMSENPTIASVPEPHSQNTWASLRSPPALHAPPIRARRR